MSQRRSGGRDRPPQRIAFEPGDDFWEMRCKGRHGAPRLLLALAEVLPPGLTLYVEGTSISPVVAAYFSGRPVHDPLPVRTSVIWPRPKAYHMPMTPENMLGLAELMEHLAAPEVADHVHAYRETAPYLIWYDAWFDSPLYLWKVVSEGAVRRLCTDLGCAYTSYRD